MRGSPLLRTLVLLLLLAVAGIGLSRLTGRATAPSQANPPPPADARVPFQQWPFELLCSAVPAHVEILDLTGLELFQTNESNIISNGVITLPGTAEALVLKVRWAAPATGHRFAKLTLEPPGRPTLRHVFDGSGDIDDVWELPPGARPSAETPASSRHD